MLRYIKIASAVIVTISLICSILAPFIEDYAETLYKKNHREKIKLIDKGKYSEVTSEIFVPENWKYLKYVYIATLTVGLIFKVCSLPVAIISGVILVICEIITLYQKIKKRGSSN